MFYSLVLLALASITEPAAFRITVNGNNDVGILSGEVELHANRIYRTEPFHGVRHLQIEVRWVDGDEIIRQFLTLRLEAGKFTEYTITVPRTEQNIGICSTYWCACGEG